MRIALYARVSTEEQIAGYSIAAQLRACRDRAAGPATEYIDEGKSAHSEDIRKRPAFRQMMADAEAGRLDLIIVHKLDRFSRHLRTTLECFERLAKADVAFVSISESIDYSTPTGRLFLAMLGALAQWYSDNLATEVSKGKQERRKQGFHNGVIPFGYIRGPDGIPVAHPDNAEGLLLAFRTAAANSTDAEVARTLNAAGYRTSGNRGLNLWTKDSVRVMLTNRFYLGELPGGVVGKHAPLIDAELFDMVQAARVKRRHNGPATIPPTRHVYSLSGLLRCGHCLESGDPNRKAQIRIHAKQAEKPRTRCYSRSQGLDCPQRSRSLEVYEKQIEEWLGQIEDISPDERLARLARQTTQLDDHAEERRRLETRLANIKELFGWGDITRDAYLAERDAITARLTTLATPIVQRDDLRAMAEVVGRAYYVWRHGTPEDMNELLSILVEAIIIKDGAIIEITPNDDAAVLLPPFVGRELHSCGSDGSINRRSAIPRYAEPWREHTPAFLGALANAAATSSISATAKRFSTSRQTVRRALGQ